MRMPSVQPTHATMMRLLAVGAVGILVSGCSNETTRFDHQASVPPRNVAAPIEEKPASRAVERPADRPDPREFKTPDGRPAPYGRDPVTGRPVTVAASPPNTEPRRPQDAYRPQADATVVVAKGESLTMIARRYNVDVESIKRANGLVSEDVRVGQRLTIPDA